MDAQQTRHAKTADAQTVDDSAELNPALSLKDGWVLLPLTAAAGGALASLPSWDAVDVPALLTAAALILGGWRPFWCALTRTRWAGPLARWRDWDAEAPLKRWPYLQPGTPGAALHRQLRRARGWWQAVGRDVLTLPLRRIAVAGIVSLLLSAVLGRIAILLTLAFTSVAELATLWHDGEGRVGTGWRALALGTLPWLLGGSLFEGGLETVVLPSLALLLLVGLFGVANWTAVFGPLAAAAFLIFRGHSIAAGWLLLFAVPGGIILARGADAERYHRAIAPWLLAMIGIFAWAVA